MEAADEGGEQRDGSKEKPGTFKRKFLRNGDYQYYEILNSELIASYHIEETRGDSIYTVAQETTTYKGA
jgi:hypothetical protein